MYVIDDNLRKTVTEYYEWHGERAAKPIRFVTNKKSGTYQLLFVRFKDAFGNKMSALLRCEKWKDGHWDVTEMEACMREDEINMIQDFENSQEFI